ncbi:DUF58 domain-containing protein [Microbacterium sp. cx-55]|uniref:DUF58 domain-containing protein n=1 Tax=Microbacterium sp. cx-55 TaxID=2875948 RepID=UPI001CBCCA86|nr:DUF58 domain-containing protein [Microbacterium sp. cx-55]MBZ4487978.1 DUF58 domain-containing protein [Microbacterium sp. cx-55]UGB34614.1 DUF58 domain-containing protein [Microbacterium sp. cx-55]
MWRSWPLTLRGTSALVLALACGLLAPQLGLVELVWLGVLLVALVAGSLVAVLASRSRADVARTFDPASPVVGTEVRVRVQVALRGGAPSLGGRWRDELPSGVDGPATGAFPALASGLSRGDRSAAFDYTAVVQRRGIHWLGPLWLSTADPFGIARRTVSLGEPTRLVVTPAVIDLPTLPGLVGRAGGAVASPVNRLGQGADDVVARPYAPGDSMRRIHWRASAHRDQLMVRQEEQETSPEATIVLDRASSRWSPVAMEHPGTDPTFERAVTLCASALVRLVHDGYAVDVIEPDGMPLCRRVESADSIALDDALLALATVTARTDDRLPAIVDLFAGATTGPLVLVSGRLMAADAAPLAAVAHHSSFPLLLATAPEPGAFTAAHGWAAAELGEDLAQSWRGAGRGGHVPA